MADKDAPGSQSGKSDAERERILEELRALRQKRLNAAGKEPLAKAPAATADSREIKNEVDISEARDRSDDAAISAVRASRMQAEAYHDVARLRKKAQHHQAKAAKNLTKHKSYEAKAQQALTKAVRFREKAAESREKDKQHAGKLIDLEKDLKSTLTEETEVTPESIRLRMAKVEKKIALIQERARKYEAKAATQNEKAAFHRSKSAFYLEQSKINEAEVKNFSKRADNLEKASL